MKKILGKNREAGQVIPIVVVGLLVILMLSAVIVDGGSIISNRRTAQAAADAGALAGAQMLCTGDTTANRTAARNAALQYVTANGAVFVSEPTFSTVTLNGFDVPGITVQAQVTNGSFFSRVMGQSELTGGATATAGCYHPSITVHLIPLAFFYNSPPVNAGEANCSTNGSCNLVNYDFTDLMTQLQNTPANNQPLDDAYIIMNEVKICEKDVVGNIVCSDMAQNASGGNRAWIDLSEVADMSNIKKIFKEGIEKPLFLPSWLNGEPGVDASVYEDKVYEDLPPIDGYESLPYRLVLVPVFDNYCDSGDPENDCPSEWVEGDSVEYIVNSNQQSYRLVGLAPFVITCVTKNGKFDFGQGITTGKNKNQCPVYTALNPDTKMDAIEGYFVTGTPLDQFAEGTGGVSAGLDIVSLVN